MSVSEGAAFAIDNPEGVSAVLLVCEHASKFIPGSLNNLELDNQTANSHVAWDPGAMVVAQHLSNILDATFISARVSRLVYDCNRPPEAAGSMPAKSEIFLIKGNQNLSDEEKNARISEIYEPFTNAVKDEIAARIELGRDTVLITIHSFTPIYFGEKRVVELGILHDQDSRLADAMLDITSTLETRRNLPYGPDDGVTHTLKLHALPNGLLNVMIEIRSDLIATEVSQKQVAAELSDMITSSINTLQNTLNEVETASA